MSIEEMKDENSPSENNIIEEKGLSDSDEESPTMKDETSPTEEVIKPGAQLAIYREQAGLTQEEVAASLKMTVRQVRELESDNYEVFHGITVARGFVRAYAKVLKVDPEPLVAAFVTKNLGSQQIEQVARQSTRSVSSVTGGATVSYDSGKGSSKKIGLIILVLVIIALAIGAYKVKFSSSIKENKPTAGQVASLANDSTKVETKSSIKDNAELKSDDKKIDIQKVEEKKVEEKKEDLQKVDQKEEVKSEEKKEEKVEKASLPEKTESTKVEAVAEPKNILSIKFSGPSKVHLYKADKSILKEVDGKLGDAQTIELKEPVLLVVEQALNVQAEFRGKPLLLRSARRSPEARVDLK